MNNFDNDYTNTSTEMGRLRQTVRDADSIIKEMSGAIKENSVVLLHLAAASKDETMRALLMSVHDSLTDAL